MLSEIDQHTINRADYIKTVGMTDFELDCAPTRINFANHPLVAVNFTDSLHCSLGVRFVKTKQSDFAQIRSP